MTSTKNSFLRQVRTYPLLLIEFLGLIGRRALRAERKGEKEAKDKTEWKYRCYVK